MIRAALAAALLMSLAGCAAMSGHAVPPAGSPDRAGAAPFRVPSELGAPSSRDARALMVGGAMSMLGQPYRFGGDSPGGFDCSGLVRYAAGGAGILLPRTAQEQLKSGEPIERGELRAGDLIFMHLAHKELHVAIAIDNERFIHAPSTGGYVRIDTLAARPYTRGFLGARRIVLTK